MTEYSQSWRKKLRIKLLVEIAQHELKGENYDEKKYKKELKQMQKENKEWEKQQKKSNK